MNESVIFNGIKYHTRLEAYQELVSQISDHMYKNRYDSHLFSCFHDSSIKALHEKAIDILFDLGVDQEDAEEKIETDTNKIIENYYESGQWAQDRHDDSRLQDYMESREI